MMTSSPWLLDCSAVTFAKSFTVNFPPTTQTFDIRKYSSLFLMRALHFQESPVCENRLPFPFFPKDFLSISCLTDCVLAPSRYSFNFAFVFFSNFKHWRWDLRSTLLKTHPTVPPRTFFVLSKWSIWNIFTLS